MVTRMTSREFNQDTARAKRAAENGAVYITDRGEPKHVLLSYAEYLRLTGTKPSIVDLLWDPEAAEIEFDIPISRELPREIDLS